MGDKPLLNGRALRSRYDPLPTYDAGFLVVLTHDVRIFIQDIHQPIWFDELATVRRRNGVMI